jgi:hypothetical protein
MQSVSIFGHFVELENSCRILPATDSLRSATNLVSCILRCVLYQMHLQNALAIMDGHGVVVYEVTGGAPLVAGSFNTNTHFICLHEQSVYTVDTGRINVHNYQVRFGYVHAKNPAVATV